MFRITAYSIVSDVAEGYILYFFLKTILQEDFTMENNKNQEMQTVKLG